MKTLIKLALLSAITLVTYNNSRGATGFWAPPQSAYETYRTGEGCSTPNTECWNWNTEVTKRNEMVTAEYRKKVSLKEWFSLPVTP